MYYICMGTRLGQAITDSAKEAGGGVLVRFTISGSAVYLHDDWIRRHRNLWSACSYMHAWSV